MGHIKELRTNTSLYFDLVNFSELSDEWIDEVIKNEFTEAEENNTPSDQLLCHEAHETLSKLADICLEWSEIGNESAIGTNTSNAEDVLLLWNVLDTMDIKVRHIQCLIYLLCRRSMEKDASVDDIRIGLGCARLYFSVLRIPGGAAYHPNLFNLCIDCMPAPDFTTDKGSSLKDFGKLTAEYVSALFSLIPVLREFHLGDDSNTLEHAIEKLCDIAACEVQVHLKFNRNYLAEGKKELQKKFEPTTVVSILAYAAFSELLSTDLNGDKEQNYLFVLSGLNRYISCYKARKNPTVSQKHLVIKDNAVAFVCHNLQTQNFCTEATIVATKKLCVGVIDKNEIRNTVSAAIITILLHLKPVDLVLMIEWFLLLVDSVDSKHRVFALDLFGQILAKTHESHTDLLPESPENDMLKVAIIFAILTRCDDVSPPVRTRALTVLSQNMECVLKFLDKTKDQANFETEDIDDEIELDVNGNHRFFWYNLNSFRERLNEIAEILQRRIEDKNVTARKAALLALENLIVFDPTYVTEENLKYFDSATKDFNIVVRKQVIQTLAAILETYRDNPYIQAMWIKCLLPLVMDSETTVQAKALSVLEELFLKKVFSSKQQDWKSAFILLKMISSDDFLAYQRYFQKTFCLWKSENKLRSQAVIQLEKYVGTEWESCVWFYLSNFSSYNAIPVRIATHVVGQFEKLDANGEYPTFMKYIIKIISNILKSLPAEKIKAISCAVSNSLKSFSTPIEVIPVYIEVFYKIHKHLETESEFAAFSSSIIQKCEEHLTHIKSAKSFPDLPSEELLVKYFSVIKEFCQLCPSNITPSVISLLKTFAACVQPSTALSKILSPGLKAHAYAALGKLCIQDEILAKDMLQVYAKELLTSKYDVIRSNVTIILIEMCKRYTSFADKYVPLISLCFKDKLYLIRYQTIVLVVNLLQEGYIKWRGPLFFCLLSSLVDEKDTIQELGRYSLSQLLIDKKKNLFSEHFIDSVFVFNFYPPPDNDTVKQLVRDLERFSMPGDQRREERMILYTFLLDLMDIKERAYLINSIREILVSIAESVYPMDKTTECIARDCFAILACKEIRSFNIEQLENIDETADNEMYKTELHTRKVIIIDPIIPAILILKNAIVDPESDLMHDVILFLKEFLHDFKDSLREVLVGDKILLKQLELEIKNDAQKEKMDKKLDKNHNKHAPAEPAQNVPVTLQGLINEVSQIKEVSSMITNEDKDRENVNSEKQGNAVSQQTPKNPSQGKHARHLSTSSQKACSSASVQSTYNISSASLSEAAELQRLASTPRVLLTAVDVSQNVLNISAIQNASEPMAVDETNDDIS